MPGRSSLWLGPVSDVDLWVIVLDNLAEELSDVLLRVLVMLPASSLQLEVWKCRLNGIKDRQCNAKE